MNLYIVKTAIELIVLIIAWAIVTGLDKRITVLEDNDSFGMSVVVMENDDNEDEF